MKNHIKSCLYCKWARFEEGVCYSTWTGCDPDSWWCGKDDFYDHYSCSDMDDLPGWALFANKCPHYELSPEVIKELEDDRQTD